VKNKINIAYLVKLTWLNNKIAKTNKEEMEKYFMIALDCSFKKTNKKF